MQNRTRLPGVIGAGNNDATDVTTFVILIAFDYSRDGHCAAEQSRNTLSGTALLALSDSRKCNIRSAHLVNISTHQQHFWCVARTVELFCIMRRRAVAYNPPPAMGNWTSPWKSSAEGTSIDAPWYRGGEILGVGLIPFHNLLSLRLVPRKFWSFYLKATFWCIRVGDCGLG